MMKLASRITSWFVRRQIAKTGQDGFNLSRIPFIPDSALMPLAREGVHPVADMRQLRESEPVTRLKLPLGFRAWLVTGYDDARAVLGSATDFSNDFSNLAGNFGITAEQNPGGLGFSDPPLHTKLRKVLTPEFTVRRLSRLTPRIERIVADTLDTIEAAAVHGPVDLMQAFALPIPCLTICELLGVDYEDRDDFQRLGAARFDLFGGASASLGAISESLVYLRGVVAKQRKNPGDDLLGQIIKEHGDTIDDEELASIADGLLTGGFETTTSMLALGAIVLLQDPEAFERLRTDDEAINAFVEELLRLLTVVQVAFPRFAKKDMVLGGQEIKAGDVVIVSLSGANRDAALGPDMEGFDPDRPTSSSHLAFGHGIHRCIGAELAKMELRIAYPALVRRFPKLRLAVSPEELAYRQVSIVYGVDELPVLVD
ncbi:cytochrome P450 [Kutzneria sp. NPDC052558]|uniref:cytochrome P450 n=1 Tax=Kutzneria sp. NPDC052558 TaxID=3364121 RepID=UPI0037C6A150